MVSNRLDVYLAPTLLNDMHADALHKPKSQEVLSEHPSTQNSQSAGAGIIGQELTAEPVNVTTEDLRQQSTSSIELVPYPRSVQLDRRLDTESRGSMVDTRSGSQRTGFTLDTNASEGSLVTMNSLRRRNTASSYRTARSRISERPSQEGQPVPLAGYYFNAPSDIHGQFSFEDELYKTIWFRLLMLCVLVAMYVGWTLFAINM